MRQLLKTTSAVQYYTYLSTYLRFSVLNTLERLNVNEEMLTYVFSIFLGLERLISAESRN